MTSLRLALPVRLCAKIGPLKMQECRAGRPTALVREHAARSG
jgi:hypothetical protein